MSMSNKDIKIEGSTDFDDVCTKAITYVHRARERVLKSVNHEQVVASWNIGRLIVEKEQEGQLRAGYGQKLLTQLSERLNFEFGRGFSLTNLKYMRQFYQTYKNRIGHKPCDQSKLSFNENIGWSHYRTLMSVSRSEVRDFYEKEAIKNHWSVPQLKRQMHSFLYERLAASKDEQGVMRLASEGQIISKPEDALKDPVVLDFLGYKEHHQYTEYDLETGIINHLQEFLLEMGRGFAFMERQKRITLNGKHYYPDLIFFHTVLRCYVVIDLKIVELSHADVGQMLLYVNYYDREIKLPDDNPTIGLLLCPDKDDAIVQYMTPKDDKQIFARKYQLHLPTVEELKKEVTKEYNQVLDKLGIASDQS